MKRALLICGCVLAAGAFAGEAHAQFYPSTTGYSPYGYNPYGYNMGMYGYGGYGYGGYSPYGGMPYYANTYGPVVTSTTPRTLSRYGADYDGPAPRARSSIYPAVTYAQFAAYEQQGATDVNSSTTPRTGLRFVADYAGPPARARRSDYPAITSEEFAAYEQRQRAADDNRATIIVYLPANAKLEINGQTMTQTGTKRTFQTPALPSTSKSHAFDLKASWTDELGARSQAATIRVRAGETIEETFPTPAKN